jgi:hypothetical protein
MDLLKIKKYWDGECHKKDEIELIQLYSADAFGMIYFTYSNGTFLSHSFDYRKIIKL